jgi:uncharacterized membrane protein
MALVDTITAYLFLFFSPAILTGMISPVAGLWVALAEVVGFAGLLLWLHATKDRKQSRYKCPVLPPR